MDLGEQAQKLETAGKEGNTDYIRDNHAKAMKDFLRLGEEIGAVFEEEAAKEPEKPVADEYLMEGIYEGLKEAAESMDCDMVEEIMKEIDGYAIPEAKSERFGRIRQLADSLDYDGLLSELNKE